MGILNVTPDSFSDGGTFLDVGQAVNHALTMLAEGASMIDVGGESTRPGAPAVPTDEELRRVLPVIEGIMTTAPNCVLSVDTSKAAVAAEAIARGASIVNDVTALRGDDAMAELVARTGVGIILMHMQGGPRTMQVAPSYQNVVVEVADFFEERRRYALASGILPECLAFDPGIGFGKTVEHNLSLLRHPDRWKVAGHPSVLGVSRKGFLAKVAGTNTMSERLWPTLALTALLGQRGGSILRVHDVRPNVAALRMAQAIIATD